MPRDGIRRSCIARHAMGEFGIMAYQSSARHSYVEQIDVGEGIPIWEPPIGADIVCGSGKTGRDRHDFAYFAPNDQFT